MKKNKNRYYADILCEQDIFSFGTIISDFEDRCFDYKTLKSRFAKLGVDVHPNIDISTRMMTLVQAKKLRNRFEEENYLPEDIKSYTLNSNYFTDVVIFNDMTMLTVLANNGNIKSKIRLKEILEWQLGKEPSSNDDLDDKINNLIEEIKILSNTKRSKRKRL